MKYINQNSSSKYDLKQIDRILNNISKWSIPFLLRSNTQDAFNQVYLHVILNNYPQKINDIEKAREKSLYVILTDFFLPFEFKR